jgi:hypothetical protein
MRYGIAHGAAGVADARACRSTPAVAEFVGHWKRAKR